MVNNVEKGTQTIQIMKSNENVFRWLNFLDPKIINKCTWGEEEEDKLI